MSIISSDAWARSTRARLRSSLLLGLAAALIVSIAGGVVLLSRPTTWTAHASLVVLPAPDIPAEAKAGYYETLGEGHVVATLGEILRNQPVAPPAAAAAGLSERERSGTKLQVQVVPGTSLIRLTVSADSPLVAERWADAVAATGVSAAAPFSRPYVVSPVGSARGTATRAGASPATLLALVAVLAAASALAVQQLTYQARRWAALLRAATTPARRSADQDVDAASAGGGHRPGFRQLRRSRSGE